MDNIQIIIQLIKSKQGNNDYEGNFLRRIFTSLNYSTKYCATILSINNFLSLRYPNEEGKRQETKALKIYCLVSLAVAWPVSALSSLFDHFLRRRV